MSTAPVWIGTSWKMNKTRAEARDFANAIAELGALTSFQLFVVPSFTAIADVADILRGSGVLVGAQNMHSAVCGAWTGEVSATQLVDCGAQLVELGHSERRQHFGETDDTVSLKVAAAQAHGLIPLVCVGESAADRDAGRADVVLKRQVIAALSRRSHAKDAPIPVFAYEPIWAIGEAGQAAEAGYANARMRSIVHIARSVLGRKTPCLYGGSVDAGNCDGLIRQPDIDGLFIGRAAWDARGFLDIVDRCTAALSSSPTHGDTI